MDVYTNFITNYLYVALVFGEVNVNIWGSLSYLGGGIAAIGCLGAGIGQGYIGGKTVEALARNPEMESKLRTQYIISAAIAESGAIYSLVLGIICLFVVAGTGQPAGS